MNNIVRLLYLVFLFSFTISCSKHPENVRIKTDLNQNWRTVANDSNIHAYDGFESPGYDDSGWQEVNIPHNYDRYHGYLRKVHGNRHGYAWYRKTFKIDKAEKGRKIFLYFEGVGSYATVWINGKKAGKHAGGRTTFTLDITDLAEFEKPNVLAVRADHPAEIRDLPWVCGGCSKEIGFSEGSQPMGIHRPVYLILTNDLRISPFGVHIWNDTSISEKEAILHLTTEISNYSNTPRNITIKNSLVDKRGRHIAESADNYNIKPCEEIILRNTDLIVNNPELWSPDKPYLYKLYTSIKESGRIIDQVVTTYGIRWISWPVTRKDRSGQFLFNGEPFFINGVGEYEHMFGNSHAFSEEQIKSRISQIKAAGFNAFRDAHQPHNLKYQELLDREGILWWTQMSTHIWFDNPKFKENFKTLLRDWVKERRNNPSNIVWGLQNESTLPTEFAKECVEIIRELDPTTSSQRIVTTCNGGTGTDWNVIQNWSGTYGGNPEKYDLELSEQLLNGEYGAWRSIDLHTEGPFNQQGILSEDRMTQLLQLKVRKAESVRNKICGQFLWIFSSHDNPGRIQSGEALRDIDRIGPVNYKGLLTHWGEPLDAFYMYRSNYVSAEKEPMVYIVSHTWPNRWKQTGIKDSITVYSNCDEVELFNDYHSESLGKLHKRESGLPFVWEDVEIKYNILHAKGFVNGKLAAEDLIILNHLPLSPHFDKITSSTNILKPDDSYKYLYRVNCGGRKIIDSEGNIWEGDKQQESYITWGSRSWTDKFKNLPVFYGSQRRTFDPVKGTKDWELFQNFRFGLKDLSFNFPVPNGQYRVELYFTEPWYGTGGGLNCEGWRVFDIGINNKIVLKNFDIWKESGHDIAIKKTFAVTVHDEMLEIHFPNILSGQAIISAIAIATKNTQIEPAPSPSHIVQNLNLNREENINNWSIETWLDIGHKQYYNDSITFYKIPSNLFGATWIKTGSDNIDDLNSVSFTVTKESDIFIALDERIKEVPSWLSGYSHTETYLENDTERNAKYQIFSKRFNAGETVNLGKNGMIKNKDANMYTVFVLPANELDAPTDQRPVVYYSSGNSLLSGSAQKKNVDGRDFIHILGNNDVEIQWKFNVGLASTYGIHFKFQNNTGGAVLSDMILETEHGIEMQRKKVEMYYKPNKWRTVKTNTGTTINAGNYIVKLRLKNAKGLLIQRMEIQ